MRRTDGPDPRLPGGARTPRRLPTAALLGLILASAPAGAEAAATGGGTELFRVGRDDGGNGELALAPRGYDRFRDDGLFLVGVSDPARDWPYAHPGPADAWAGSRSHTFSIAFGLATAPAEGTCRLTIDLLDTHGSAPPRLRIDVNERSFERATPRGAGDHTIFGDPGRGRAHTIVVEFPAEALREGNNHVGITTLSGSWILYDWIGLETPAGARLGRTTGSLVASVEAEPVLERRGDDVVQTVRLVVLHLGSPTRASVRISGREPVGVDLRPGRNTTVLEIPRVAEPTEVVVEVLAEGEVLAKRAVPVRPAREWVVYLLPHSHVDIGYTHVQTDVERSHFEYYRQAIRAARETADYPEGARFKWNVEVLWATDSYLRQASPDERAEFLDAVRRGWIGLDALYGNELTGLCRPEELVRLVDLASRLRRDHGLSIDSAMISDVPGYTWGITEVLAQSGVRYFSIGPNGGHRIGYTLSEWGDRPFWWVSPSGQHRVLCWIPRTGYWRGFRGAGELMKLLQGMDEAGYPYDLVQIRHCLGDNAGPGADLSDFVRDWNAKYAYPRLVIATTSEMMRDFDRRYGKRIPEVRGDFTPYWEDGAASSARETALNREAAERLVQAETLFGLLAPTRYRPAEFDRAWRDVLLYDEHTWGAHSSISQPESDFVKAQWAIKQRFALDASRSSLRLLGASLAAAGRPVGQPGSFDVLNTCSFRRTDLVVLPASADRIGHRVVDALGAAVPSQLLRSGELAFLARDVPALGARRYRVVEGPATPPAAPVTAAGLRLDGAGLSAIVDPGSGAVRSVVRRSTGVELVDSREGLGLDDYLYVAGRSPERPRGVSGAHVEVGEPGPLVASLVVRSEAPGCRALRREYRVVAGIERLDITNRVDKELVYDQEAVHFAFPFRADRPVVRKDIPWAVARVETDQIAGACRNYLTVQRWVDVSEGDRGVTWATLDAPLVEVGRITCDPVSVGWLRRLEPSGSLFSYAMNNYWETNYKAGQQGPTTFRYSVRPHGPYDPAAAQRFGIGRSQPLVVSPARGPAPDGMPLLEVRPSGVLVTLVRPEDGGRRLLVRLFNTSDEPARVELRRAGRRVESVEICDLGGSVRSGPVSTLVMAPLEVATCRVAPLERRAGPRS